MNDNWHGAALKESKPEPTILYVSGPMSGYEDSNYPEFNEATATLRELGFTVFNPAEVNPEGLQYTGLLALDLADVLQCEGVAVLEGWWNSVGARMEVNVAGTLGKPVRSVEEWIHRKLVEASTTLTD